MKKIVLSAAIGVSALLPALVWSQGFAPAKGDDALRYRQSVMFLMGQHAGLMAAMLKGAHPYDQKTFLRNAELLRDLSVLPWDSFWVPGSNEGKNRVKPEVAQKRELFLERSKRLQDASTKLVAAAEGGDQGNIKTAFGAVGQACKSCHDDYRSE